MNAKRFSLTLVAVCLSLSVAEQASAYYAAHMGRWLTRDPNGEIGRYGMDTPPDSGMAMGFVDRDQFDPMGPYHDGMNLYGYVNGMPVAEVDPFGLAGYYGPCGRMCARHGTGAATCKSCCEKNPDSFGCSNEFGDDFCITWAQSKNTAGIVEPHSEGQYRHCLAACCLMRRWGVIGSGMIAGWDYWNENPSTENSQGDMAAERSGKCAANSQQSCEEACKGAMKPGSPCFPKPDPPVRCTPQGSRYGSRG